MAAEHCAKNLHLCLLRLLTKISGEVTQQKLRLAMHGALTALDDDLQKRMPGLEGSGLVSALVAGRLLCLGAVGSCKAVLCEVRSAEEEAELALGKAKLMGKLKAKEAAEKALAAGPSYNPVQLGVTSRTVRSVGGRLTEKSAPQVFLKAEEVKLLELKSERHPFLILGSGGLFGGEAGLPVHDLVKAVAKHPGKRSEAGEAAAKLAMTRQLSFGKDKAKWVQAEIEKRSEINCVTLEFVWDKEELDEVVPKAPPAKKPKLAEPVPIQQAGPITCKEVILNYESGEELVCGKVFPDQAAYDLHVKRKHTVKPSWPPTYKPDSTNLPSLKNKQVQNW